MNLVRGSFTLILAAGLGTSAMSQTAQLEPSMTKKDQVVALLKSIETGETAPVAAINPNQYIQHNLAVGDGLAGFGALLQQLPKGSAKVNTVRVFQDGNYVFAHTDYDFFGPKIGFDVFRFEDGKIVEHWDNLAEKAAGPNKSGHTQLDGPTQATDLAKTESNKKRVQAFYEDILMKGKKEKIADYFDGDRYIQHGAGGSDGSAFFGRLAEMVNAPNPPIKFTKIHRVLGEGNFVLIVAEGDFRGKPTAFYDLFRVENDKIAEHWDTIETIPAKSEWKNNNGKF